MSSKSLAERLGKLLDSTGFFQTVDSKFKEDQVTAVGRTVVPEPQWLQFVTRIKAAEENPTAGWSSFIAKAYFRKEVKDSKRLVFAWYVIVNSSNLSQALDVISRLARGEDVPAETNTVALSKTASTDTKISGESDSFSLPGVPEGKDRNAPKPGSFKGVRTISETR